MSVPVYLNDLGLVCALGAGKAEVAERLFKGERGVTTISDAVSDGTTLPFAPVTTPLPETPRHLARYASRNLSLALKALEEVEPAIHSAVQRYGEHRVAVVMGTSTSGISEGEALLGDPEVRESGQLPSDYDFVRQEIGSVAESIAAYYQLTGPALTISTACSSGAKALSSARRLIRHGAADAVITGACDSRCALTLNGFHSLSALTRDACLPFSANRDGTLIGEGAAIFLMTSEAAGVELKGVGESSDGHNMTAPEPNGAGAIAAMRMALADADLDPGDISYINLHGTATSLNDAMESRAVRAIYPTHVSCSSSKGQIGHTLGAAGAVEAAICWLTLRCNPGAVLPPHSWDGAADPEASLPGLVTGSERLPDDRPRYLMSNSYAFGGNNASLILGGDP